MRSPSRSGGLIRHVRVAREVFRHRMVPGVAARLEQMQVDSQLDVRARPSLCGRLSELTVIPELRGRVYALAAHLGQLAQRQPGSADAADATSIARR